MITAIKKPRVHSAAPATIPHITYEQEGTMAKINVPEFTGASDEDSARWCRLLECAFVPARKQYTEESGMSEDVCKDKKKDSLSF